MKDKEAAATLAKSEMKHIMSRIMMMMPWSLPSLKIILLMDLQQ